MKKNLLISLIVGIFFSCDFGDLKGVSTENSGSSSFFSSVSTNGVLPPKNIRHEVAISQGTYSIKVFWNPISNVNKYIIETIESDGTKKEFTSELPEWVFVAEFAADQTTYTKNIVISSININGKRSVASNVYEISISKSDSYNETVLEAYLSRGTETGITLTWSRAKEADYYKIERQLTGDEQNEDRETVIPIFLSANETSPRFIWTDATAKAGFLYDYIITPVNALGILGRPKMVKEGFILPLPQNIEVSAGSNVFSTTGVTVIDIKFDLVNKLQTFAGVTTDPGFIENFKPTKINLYVGESPKDALSQIKSIDSLSADHTSNPETGIDLLAKWSNTMDINIPVEDGNMTEITIGGDILFYAGNIDNDIEITYVYRLVLKPHSNFAIWATPYYFTLNIDYALDTEDKLPSSGIVFGWATSTTNKDATLFEFVSQEIVTAEDGSLSVALDWDDQPNATTYYLYQKQENEGGWSLIPSDSSLILSEASLPVEKNKGYYYGVAWSAMGENATDQSRIVGFSQLVKFVE